MGEDFLGKILTREVVKDIKETGSDACGENGEYHTCLLYTSLGCCMALIISWIINVII